MPDIVINGFLHLVGYRTIVCHFRKDSGLKLFYGHVLWGLGPVYGYLRFFGGWFGCGSSIRCCTISCFFRSICGAIRVTYSSRNRFLYAVRIRSIFQCLRDRSCILLCDSGMQLPLLSGSALSALTVVLVVSGVFAFISYRLIHSWHIPSRNQILPCFRQRLHECVHFLQKLFHRSEYLHTQLHFQQPDP